MIHVRVLYIPLIYDNTYLINGNSTLPKRVNKKEYLQQEKFMNTIQVHCTVSPHLDYLEGILYMSGAGKGVKGN